jgi:hypothetical protein
MNESQLKHIFLDKRNLTATNSSIGVGDSFLNQATEGNVQVYGNILNVSQDVQPTFSSQPSFSGSKSGF